MPWHALQYQKAYSVTFYNIIYVPFNSGLRDQYNCQKRIKKIDLFITRSLYGPVQNNDHLDYAWDLARQPKAANRISS